MNFKEIMNELEKNGNDRTKNIYVLSGAVEPLFGNTSAFLNTILKKTGLNQELAEELYATGNYDAMFFAGMIAEPLKMTKDDFNRWIYKAYFYMLSDYTVAVTLAESPLAVEVALEWIDSDKDLVKSAGWSTFVWLLGYKKDEELDYDIIKDLLDRTSNIHSETERTRYAMNEFVMTVAISYKPLHEEAVKKAKEIGEVEYTIRGKSCSTIASIQIEKAINANRIGFKRKKVRC